MATPGTQHCRRSDRRRERTLPFGSTHATLVLLRLDRHGNRRPRAIAPAPAVTKLKMTLKQTRGEIDLSLPIECVEQSHADLLRVGRQVIEPLAAITGDAGLFR
jgi:hypothetical protein